MRELQGLPTTTVNKLNKSTSTVTRNLPSTSKAVTIETLKVTVTVAIRNNRQLNANSNGVTVLIGHVERVCYSKLKRNI